MKSHEPFQSYLLTGKADSAKKAGYLHFHHRFYLKIGVSRNDLSLGYSKWDTSSVCGKLVIVNPPFMLLLHSNLSLALLKINNGWHR